MKVKIKPCLIIGRAFRLVKVGKFGREKTIAIGLTKWEAEFAAKRKWIPS